MDNNCTHDCSSCGESCESRQSESLIELMNKYSNVKNVIAVVSGKGGVGKSLVTSLMASRLSRQGFKTAVLDADVTGPSIPKMFGMDEVRANAEEKGIIPPVAANGTKIISVNLLLEDNTSPVVWRGPVIAGVVKQFWSDVVWGDVDYMFVDMPPGTGDVPLTVFQSLPVKGVIIVTSPQQLVSMIVEKAANMAQMMNVPVIGIVEDMAYFECPNCHERYPIFGESHIEKIAEKHDIKTISRIPMDMNIAHACDFGCAADIEGDWLDNMVHAVKSL